MPRKREIISILGSTGSGKSHMIKTRILPALAGCRVFIVDRLYEYPYGVVSQDIDEFGDSLREPNATGVYTLQTLETDEAQMVMLAAWSAGNCWLILDEVDAYCGVNQIDPELLNLIRYGRHRSVSLVTAARRPSEIHPAIRAQSDLLVSFVQREPRDISVLCDRSENFRGVADLKQFEYILSGNCSIHL